VIGVTEPFDRCDVHKTQGKVTLHEENERLAEGAAEPDQSAAAGMREGSMAKRKTHEKTDDDVPISVLERLPLWQLDIVELTGHNLEVRGREEVNRLLEAGWRLLHIYTLKYEEDGVWRERPMGILGRLRNGQQQDR
jgi:hypothetical protein